MKTLIAYYSFTGNNETLARALQLKMNCDIYKITEIKKRKAITILFDIAFRRLPKVAKPTTTLDHYDHIIFCSPIWNGKIASPLKSFLINEKDHIQQYSFITICGGRSGQDRWINDELKKVTEKTPVSLTELMVNNLPPSEQTKYTAPNRIEERDIMLFDSKIDHFLNSIKSLENVRR
jgi:flavodoxin